MFGLGGPTTTPPPAVLMPETYVAPSKEDPDFNIQLQYFLKKEPPVVMHQKMVAPGDHYIPFDLNQLLDGGTYFEYAGSLTAPPCAEVVTWFVRREPLLGSARQVAILHDAIFQISADFGNFRSTMPLNGRPVAIREARREVPPPPIPPPPPAGPTPNTDREFRAVKWSWDALKIAKAATNYVKDMDSRLRHAAYAHAKVMAPDLMAHHEAATPPPPPRPVGPPIPMEMAKTTQTMAAAISKAARQAIHDASVKIAKEADEVAKSAAQQASQLAATALAPPPPPVLGIAGGPAPSMMR